MKWDWDSLAKWLGPKIEFWLLSGGIMIGIYFVAKSMSSKKARPALEQRPLGQLAPGRRYTSLPEACQCGQCGYIVRNPGVHCPEISCPRCGGRMWRVK